MCVCVCVFVCGCGFDIVFVRAGNEKQRVRGRIWREREGGRRGREKG